MTKTTRKQCGFCNESFYALNREIKRGFGRFCSRKCSGRHKSATSVPKKPNVECALCGKKFYKSPSKQKSSKSGLFFCCREHKDISQSLEKGMPELWPDHYGSGKGQYTYRNKVNLQECEVCGWKEVPEVLEVHHKDTNRLNNKRSNLLVVCPTCHEVEHFKNKTGKWGQSMG